MTVTRSFIRSKDNSTGTVSLKVFEDPEQGLHTVIRSEPGNMLMTDIFRFEDRADALAQFGEIVKSFQSRGFIECGEPVFPNGRI